jgi:hypothetical protein
MKQQLNEVQRLQKLAGILKEAEDVSPEQAAAQVTKTVGKLEQSPVLDKIATDIAKDPKALKQLEDILKGSGVNPESLSENIDTSAIKKLALTMAKKAETMEENISEESNYGASFLTGLFGGGTLAYYIAKAGDVLTAHQKLMGFSPSHMTEVLIGAIAGAILAVVATKVYDKIKGN